MNFTLDGVTTTQHYFVGNISSFGVLTFHFPYFRNDTLPSGNHILIATIVDVIGNATASIDYITYRPNFALVAEKPIFPDLPSATGINGTASSPSATLPSPSVIHSPSATPSLAPNRPPKLHPIGAIVGGTIAGVVLVVVLWFGLWCRQKRKKLRSNENIETRSDSTCK
jgi:hypothetical protein